MDKQNIFIILVLVVVSIGMVSSFTNVWKESWEREKTERICLPYVGNGYVAMYEYEETCSDEEKAIRDEFIDWYCGDKNRAFCVAKGDEKMKVLYDEYLSQKESKENKDGK